MQTGTTFAEIVLDTLPDAEISYYNSYPDMAAARAPRRAPYINPLPRRGGRGGGKKEGRLPRRGAGASDDGVGG